MTYASPRAAIEALARSVRASLQSVARAEIVASEFTTKAPGNLIVVSSENLPPNTVQLRRPDRTPFLHLKIATEYSVIQHLEVPARFRYEAVVTMYMYAVNDLTGRELFAYHFHPSGLSPIKTPHLHWSAATPIALPLRTGNSAIFELDMSRAHFPTHHLELPELIRLLIRDFGVGPRRRNWEQILERP